MFRYEIIEYDLELIIIIEILHPVCQLSRYGESLRSNMVLIPVGEVYERLMSDISGLVQG